MSVISTSIAKTAPLNNLNSPLNRASGYSGYFEPKKNELKDQIDFSAKPDLKQKVGLADESRFHSKLLEIFSKTRVSEGTTVFIDPSLRSDTDPITRKLAFKQTYAARNLLYFPGTLLSEQLAKAAQSLKDIVKHLNSSELRDLTEFEFGEGGYRPNAPLNQFHSILERLIEQKRATAVDRVVFLSVMANLGHRLIDKYGSNQPGPDTLDNFLKIAKSNGLVDLSPEKIKRIYLLTHFRNLDPRKRKLQPVENTQTRVKRTTELHRFPIRVSVHNIGEQVDDALGIEAHKRIPGLRWHTGLIDSNLVARTKEPLVDQMSSRLAKGLMVWDLLCGQDPEAAYDAFTAQKMFHVNLNSDALKEGAITEKNNKLARLSGVSALNVAAGFHSAFENVGGALRYLGKDFRSYLGSKQEPEDVFGSGVSTKMIVDLLNSQAVNSKTMLKKPVPDFEEVEVYLRMLSNKLAPHAKL